MNFFKNEKTLLTIIKLGPMLSIIILCFIFTEFFIQQQSRYFEEEIEHVQVEYIEQNKLRVKEEVNRIYTILEVSSKNIETDLKKEVISRAEEAHLLATKIYKQSKEKKLRNKETLHIIKTTLGNMIFDQGKGYYFIIDEKGILLLQPLNKELENKSMLTMNNGQSKELANNMIRFIKNKTDAYDTYFWHKKDTPTIKSKKISFSKYFEPFNFMIGTGRHIDEHEKTIQERLLLQINNLKFNNDGFIFIYHLNGTNLAHLNKKFINKNHLTIDDPLLKNNTNQILQTIKATKEGFVQITENLQSKENNKNRIKVSYVRLFKEWNWIIGSGFYIDKLEEKIKQRQQYLQKQKDEVIQKILFGSIFITIISFIISIFIAKMLEQHFRKYKENIETETNKTLENEKLLIQQSKLATMGEMIGNIAHQWKQPLSIINMSVGSIQVNKELDTLTPEDIDTSTKEIQEASNYLTETIDDFKNFFNPSKEKKYFTTTDLVKKMLRLVHAQYKNNDIEIIQNIENIELLSYQNELLQVLINLLNNARDALVTKEKNSEKYIFIDIYSEKEQVIIKIKDTANGIPENIIKKIFDSHFTTKTNSGGTGIGLYMSKQIIENSINGKLSVENIHYTYNNTNYMGAEFSIIIPNSEIN